MSYINELLRCADCNHEFEELLERDKRDDTYPCPECGKLEAKRTWGVPHVSTAKTSASMPDAVGKGRFDGIRTAQALRRAKQEARVSGDRESEKKIATEITRSQKC